MSGRRATSPKGGDGGAGERGSAAPLRWAIGRRVRGVGVRDAGRRLDLGCACARGACGVGCVQHSPHCRSPLPPPLALSTTHTVYGPRRSPPSKCQQMPSLPNVPTLSLPVSGPRPPALPLLAGHAGAPGGMAGSAAAAVVAVAQHTELTWRGGAGPGPGPRVRAPAGGGAMWRMPHAAVDCRARWERRTWRRSGGPSGEAHACM